MATDETDLGVGNSREIAVECMIVDAKIAVRRAALYGKKARERDGLHAWNGARTLEHWFVKAREPLAVGALRHGRRGDVERQQPIGREAWIGIDQRDKAPNHQSSRDEQHERERHFGGDQCVERSAAARTGAGPAGSFAEVLAKSYLRGAA